MQKNRIGLKKLKVKIIKKLKRKGRKKKSKKKEGKLLELQKANVEAGVYNNNKKM